MSAALVLIAIFSLAAFLVALGLGLSRRAARREAGAGATPRVRRPRGAPEAGAGSPPAPAPGAGAAVRLRDGLARARRAVGDGLAGLLRRDRLDGATWEAIEETLLAADVGITTTTAVLEVVRAQVAAARVTEPGEVLPLLATELVQRLEGADRTLRRASGGPSVWMLVGVNGVGKTTTIAKLAAAEHRRGGRAVLAAADTFRAAAGDQLGEWASRVGAELVRGAEGGDPGAVAFDALAAARSRDASLVLVDTAGRMHTRVNLMRELEKVRRVIERVPGALQEVLLVLDATTGQNGLAQAREFTGAVGVTGIVVTKLDGTAKGGIALAVEADLGIPVKLVGVGEGIEDLVAFDPVEYVSAIVGDVPTTI